MGRRADHARTELVELLGGRPGWRLEPRTTPGATPMWCFVSGGEIEFSVAADAGAIHLYVMATDKEFVFSDAEQLRAWLRVHREDALQEAAPRSEEKKRSRRFFEWS